MIAGVITGWKKHLCLFALADIYIYCLAQIQWQEKVKCDLSFTIATNINITIYLGLY